MLRIKIKSASDAHILLSNCKNCDGYEIVIGGWQNTQSVIREKKQTPAEGNTKQQVKRHVLLTININPPFKLLQTKSILSAVEFREFWIRTGNVDGKKRQRVIQVGKAGEATPFMQHRYPFKHKISHIGISTWGKNSLHYEIINGDIPRFLSTKLAL